MKKNLILLIVASVAGMGFAATTYDLKNGNVTVPNNTTATITQSNNGTATANTITVGTNSVVTISGINFSATSSSSIFLRIGNAAKVTLNGVRANASSGDQGIKCSGSATIILADGSANSITNASNSYATIYPGPSGSTLTIKGGTSGTGTLTVVNKYSYYNPMGAIGSDYYTSCGNIVIEGGRITAKADGGAAAIGGDETKCGKITIKGGRVDAYSSSGAGIGGYCNGVAISGGTVIAKGTTGIGNSSRFVGGCGDITISGGNVTATGAAAGIGSCSYANSSACGAIKIIGGTVTAKGGSAAAGIGTGIEGICGAITIADTVEKVTVTKGGSDVLSYIGKADSRSSVGTVTIGSKLQKTLSNNNLTQTLTPAYTITWKDSNGTTLETDTLVLRGTTPTYNGATPTKASTAQYSYAFAGWSPAVAAATADKTYTATYTQTIRSYKVTWKDDDGTTLKTDTLLYGAMPDYGANPTKESTAQYSYTFAGWSPSIVAVTGAATYTATYDTTERIPDIDDDASEEAVNAAVDSANFADAAVKAVIGGNASEYWAFKTWASGVAGGEAAVVASTNAAVSYMLGAERLFVNAPEIEFGECEVATDTGEVVISITVKDGEDAVAVASEKVKEMFEATSDLNDWYSAGKRLVPVVTDLSQGQSSILRFRVLPGDGTSPSAFLRIRK